MTNKIVWIAAIEAIAILLISAVTINFIYSGLSPASTSTPTSTPTSSQSQTPVDQASLNWAGYAVATNFSDPKPVATGVSGSWVIPQIQVSQSDSFSAIWVGIGGTFGQTLIQAGTEQDSINGVAVYSAWYELLPADSVTVTTVNVSPGDAVTVSIKLVNSNLDIWSIELNDLTTGQNFIQDFTYDSSRLSAEWIVERPDVDNALSNIADFGSITFSNCTAEVNNQAGALAYFPLSRSFMYNSEGMRLVGVSDYFSNGSSFTASYITS